MSKPQHPGAFDLTSQMDDRETFEVFEQVFPLVMPIQEFQFKMQRLAADYGETAVEFTVALLKLYGVRNGSELPAERRRNFYATVMLLCERNNSDNTSHNGEYC